MNVVSAQSRKITRALTAEIYAKFHKATGVWVYRNHGCVRGNVILQRLSCNDLVRKHPGVTMARVSMLCRAWVEFQKETKLATESADAENNIATDNTTVAANMVAAENAAAENTPSPPSTSSAAASSPPHPKKRAKRANNSRRART